MRQMCGKDKDEKRTENIAVVLGSKSSSNSMPVLSLARLN